MKRTNYFAYLSGSQIKFFRQSIGLSRKDFADKLGYKEGTLEGWETDCSVIPVKAHKAIEKMMEENRK